MHRFIAAASAAAAVLAGGLLLAGPAYADHNAVTVTIESPGECEPLRFSTAWQLDIHRVASTVLVVQANGRQVTAPIGETIQVGPFDEPTTVRYRVWGGGERAYDDPPLADLDALLAYLETHPGGELDIDVPGVAWHEQQVDGCGPEPTTEPTDEPTDEPSDEPTDEPTDEPSDEPSTDGKGAGELPKTGAPLPLLTGAGVLLMVAGGVGLVAGRRRRIL